MSLSATERRVLYVVLTILIVGVVLSLVSFLPTSTLETQTSTIIDSSFRLTPGETYRQGLGSFHGNENITLLVSENGTAPAKFLLLTYSGTRYNTTAPYVDYVFAAGADYYEAVFEAGASCTADIHLQVLKQNQAVEYAFSWLSTSAKVLFVACWMTAMALIVKPVWKGTASDTDPAQAQQCPAQLEKNNLRLLKIGILFSLAFWLLLLVLNTYPLATFENWYTDAARHPYTSALFTRVGFQVFDTPLGKLASLEGVSAFKFVSWAEMPHLYPLGSIFIFLPFGVMLETGLSQPLVFKLEIALLLIVAHLCLYFFLKRFWRQELRQSPKEVWGMPLWRQEFNFALKVLATYLLFIVLVVYSADGQFDAVAFLFALGALGLFVSERYDYGLLLMAVACTFKYQAGIFLAPLAIVSLLLLLQRQKPITLLKNRAILGGMLLATLDVFTALLSSPFMINVRPELVMNGVNAFLPHAQISWGLQTFATLLTLSVTIACAVYLAKRSPIVSLFMVFSLLPVFSMPYFQPWYMPFFFVYPLVSQSKRALMVTLVWVIFMVFVLSFGGLAYNPLTIADNIRKVLRIA